MKISVCIPTYKRPEMLYICIKSILENFVDKDTIEIIVVDNDKEMSAEQCVQNFQREFKNIKYYNETESNISIARNRAVAESDGELIAFIDDDEFADKEWLINLIAEIQNSDSDGVLGPVVPFFMGESPSWIEPSGLYDRKRFRTGTSLVNHKFMRTGNVIFKKRTLKTWQPAFNPELGNVGGEDVDFFYRALAKGFKFTWCDTAIVHEHIPTERQSKEYQIERACFRGIVSAKTRSLFSMDSMKSVAAIIVYLLMLPILRIFGMHLYMKYLIKFYDHWSKLLARFGVKIIKGKRR